MSALTEDQYEALRWIARNENARSEWTHHGRAVRARQDWTHLKISGPKGSILIAAADMKAIAPLLAAGPWEGKSIHVPNDAGWEALARYAPALPSSTMDLIG